MHPSAERLFFALGQVQNAIVPLEPGRVAVLMSESPATVTNWKTRGVSKAGALKAGELHKINPSWVTTGQGRMMLAVTTIPQMGEDDTGKSNYSLVGLNKSVPRVAWSEIQGFLTGMFTPPADRYEVVSARQVTERCFLVEVEGDAMKGPADSVPAGSLLLCDPERPAESGAYVIAIHPKSGEPVFRRLVIDGGVWFLKANDPAYPLVEVSGPAAIVARVVRIKMEMDV